MRGFQILPSPEFPEFSCSLLDFGSSFSVRSPFSAAFVPCFILKGGHALWLYEPKL